MSTNIYLRRIHNFALGINWQPAPVIPTRMWPSFAFKDKRAITLDERGENHFCNWSAILLPNDPHPETPTIRQVSPRYIDADLCSLEASCEDQLQPVPEWPIVRRHQLDRHRRWEERGEQKRQAKRQLDVKRRRAMDKPTRFGTKGTQVQFLPR